MRTIFLMSFLACAAGCQNESITDTSTGEQSPVTKPAEQPKAGQLTDSVAIGFMETYEGLNKLKLVEITEKEYNNSPAKKSPDRKHAIPQDQSDFYLETAAAKVRFEKEKNAKTGGSDGEQWNEFIGYYKGLNLYAIGRNSVSEGLSFSELSLVDSVTNYNYTIISIGDWRVEDPVPSADNRYLAYYYNQAYEENTSFIAVVKVNSKKDPKNYLTEYSSFDSDQFAIRELTWLNNTTIAIRTQTAGVKGYTYYKANLPK